MCFYSTSTIIPTNNGNGYVYRDFQVEEKVEFRWEDSLKRTKKDRTFLEQFKLIFLAAESGDIEKCRKVVENKFYDFNAASVGLFYDSNQKRYINEISPLKIAEMKNYKDIVCFFNEMTKNIKNENVKVPESLPNEKWVKMTNDAYTKAKTEKQLDDILDSVLDGLNEKELKTTHSDAKVEKQQLNDDIKGSNDKEAEKKNNPFELIKERAEKAMRLEGNDELKFIMKSTNEILKSLQNQSSDSDSSNSDND